MYACTNQLLPSEHFAVYNMQYLKGQIFRKYSTTLVCLYTLLASQIVLRYNANITHLPHAYQCHIYAAKSYS